jgi:hypothetical protein
VRFHPENGKQVIVSASLREGDKTVAQFDTDKKGRTFWTRPPLSWIVAKRFLSRRLTTIRAKRIYRVHPAVNPVAAFSVIALWLGHESLETTHQYVEADVEMKRRVLERLDEPPAKASRKPKSEELLDFLNRL